jgi:two-component system, NarL family, nitrate/nitrite response regulator NarL
VAAQGSRVRVLVADDHPIYREGIVRAVKERPDLELVGEAGDGRAALEEIHRTGPDVAVLDIRMPGLDGTQVLGALRRDEHTTHVLFVSAFMEPDLAYSAIAAGARGYLSKESSRQEICDAIVAVARGETAFAPEVQEGLQTAVRARGRSDGTPSLTDREFEVLRLIAEGLTAPQIGRRIHLSPATVKTHLRTLYEKLEVSDRAAAVAEGMRRGLLE